MEQTVELIKKTCSVAMMAQNEKLFKEERSRCSCDEVIFGFPGIWSLTDWTSDHKCFRQTDQFNRTDFPSMKRLGNDEVAFLNEAFIRRFQSLLAIINSPESNSSFTEKVHKAMEEKKKIIFTGHSLGGSMAILATIWLLEKYGKQENQNHPLCVTFGCPLIGNSTLSHAIRRQKWSKFFFHIVMSYDIVPRILLAPLSSIKPHTFESLLESFEQLTSFATQMGPTQPNISFILELYNDVMRNASILASHVACNLMDTENFMVETLTNYLDLSTYRPFGTYFFYTQKERLVSVDNSNAVLQLLFFSSQLITSDHLADKGREIVNSVLGDHIVYPCKLLQESSSKLQITKLVDAQGLLCGGYPRANELLDELNVSTKGRLCFLAAVEAEKEKIKNQEKLEKKIPEIKEYLNEIKKYRDRYKIHKVAYYDAFKLSENQEDFKANVKRLELAAIWDEIIDMVRKYQLPDEFEGNQDWIELGTEFRRLVEPLDVANYYRHSRDVGGGKAYNETGARPGRYRYTQKWLEHMKGMPLGSSNESFFWADVENLIRYPNDKEYIERANKLQENLEKWYKQKVIGEEVFFHKSTFVVWWKSLPKSDQSCGIREIISSMGD